MARDLHDILGHSLTVITIKAELASRLLDVDLDRARAELADLERLTPRRAGRRRARPRGTATSRCRASWPGPARR